MEISGVLGNSIEDAAEDPVEERMPGQTVYNVSFVFPVGALIIGSTLD